MKYQVLINPMAGSGDKTEQINALSSFFNGEICCHEVTEIGSYNDFIASLDEDDIIILCGGDGTLNRFANDTQNTVIKNEILYYAIGTGNDFLRDIEKQPDAAPFSVKEYITDLPVVEINGKQYHFLNNVGFGIDGYCCEVGDEIKKISDKPVNYTAIAIKGLLFHYKPTNATVVVDGVTHHYKKVWIAPTMKGRFYGGGMMPTPKQDRKDPEGKLSLMLFYGKGKIATLLAFPSLFKGEHVKHTDMVAIHEGKDITVTFDRPSTIQIDGETIVGVTEYHAMAKVPAADAAFV